LRRAPLERPEDEEREEEDDECDDDPLEREGEE
jgi:hypothetical protein